MSNGIERKTYKCRGIEGSEQYGYSQAGQGQIALDLQLETGDVVTTILAFAGNAAPYAIDRLRALGWEGDDLTDLRGIGCLEARCRVFDETYNGETKMKVEIVSGGMFSFKQEMDEGGKRQFAAQFRELARASRLKNGGGTSAPARQAAPPAEVKNDDIPF